MTPDDPQIPDTHPLPGTDALVSQSVREQDKVHLILCYLGVLSLIPLLVVKDSAFVRWHAKQGMTLTVAMVVFLIVAQVIPFLGFILACPLAIAWIVFSIMGVSKGLAGERWRIPLIADISEKF